MSVAGAVKPLQVAIAWKWFPFYAAASIGELPMADEAFQLRLYGTRSARPFDGLEDVAGRTIRWLPEGEDLTWEELGEPPPDLLILSGWKEKSFLSLARSTKRAGGRCVTMVDNRYRGDWRQRLGAAYYKALLARVFDGAWVPGASGTKLMQNFGLRNDRLWSGLYGADPARFKLGPALIERPKRFLYVGAFLKRKGLDLLLNAWPEFHKQFPDWEIQLIGNNDPDPRLRSLPGVRLEGFVQPKELPERLQGARCLLLPSYDENWGVVVHEAICCGCMVLVSSAVGSAPDLVNQMNGRIFESGNSDVLLEHMVAIANSDQQSLNQAFKANQKSRKNFGPDRWVDEFTCIVKTFANAN